MSYKIGKSTRPGFAVGRARPAGNAVLIFPVVAVRRREGAGEEQQEHGGDEAATGQACSRKQTTMAKRLVCVSVCAAAGCCRAWMSSIYI